MNGRWRLTAWLVPLLLIAVAHAQAQADSPYTKVGPPHGTLVIHGGGNLSQEFLNEFVALAKGPDVPLVVIPTAYEADEFPKDWPTLKPFKKAGFQQITLLHARDRVKADSAEFVRPLQSARAVWITGGRQWRLADAYLGTRTQRALRGVLDRGGVIGGSSAGATIQGSYLVRGDTKDNTIVISPGHEQGFGFLRQVAIDQHLLTRHRERDLLAVMKGHPELLGIGIDEQMAIIVRGDQFEVIGRSKVAIYDAKFNPPSGAEPFYFLERGDAFDLASRRKIESPRAVEIGN